MPWQADFQVPLEDLTFVGEGLNRPECVLATRSGKLFVPDWRGGVAIVHGEGRTELILGYGEGPRNGLKANGIALRQDGSMLLAQLDDHEGGVWSMMPDGRLSPWLTELEGEPLPPTNFVIEDNRGRVWVTVSTRLIPRGPARRPDHADGFIVLVDDRGPRIVADGLAFTNEAQVDPSGDWLYVNETFGRRLSRFQIRDNGSLGLRSTVTEFENGIYPDGLDFDVEGGVWITSVFSNRVIRVAPNGSAHTVLEDNDPDFLAEIDRDFSTGALAERGKIDVPGRTLRNVSSIAFGGPDLRTAYLGCLQGDQIACFRTPIAGVEPPHWYFG
jgi:sugar lactone lactonase YvrE